MRLHTCEPEPFGAVKQIGLGGYLMLIAQCRNSVEGYEGNVLNKLRRDGESATNSRSSKLPAENWLR